jgi:hypothetical protein
MLTRGMSRAAMTRRRALVLAVAVVFAVVGCSSAAAPSVSPFATSTPSPAPSAVGASAPATPTIEPSSSVVPMTWQPLDLFSAANGALFPSFAASDASGFLVVATDGHVSRVWSSPDAVTWTTDVLPTAAESNANPYTGAAGVDRTVLLGVGEGQCAHPVADFTWARPAGTAWAAAPWQPIFCAGGQGSIATDGHTFVVAGTGAGDQPFLWSSADGLTWTNVPVTAEIAPVAVAWTGSEFLALARGQSGFVALTSPDGADWASAAGSGLPGGGLPRLFVLSGRTVALLAAADGSLVAYERQASGAWQTAATTGLQASADDVTTTTSSGGLGFVFLSTTAAGGSVLASADGLAWRTVPSPTATRFNGAAVFGDRAVLVGAMDAAGGTQALAWWGPASLVRGG